MSRELHNYVGYQPSISIVIHGEIKMPLPLSFRQRSICNFLITNETSNGPNELKVTNKFLG